MIRARWLGLWRRLGAIHPPAIEPLLERLGETQRHYHTLTHIRHCLTTYDRGPLRDDAVELALWMHDAIYDPQAKDNEARSAAWCRDLCAASGVANVVAARANACILATCHRHQTFSPAEALTVSVDLAILGESSELFAAYDRNVRREYAWVDMPSYRRGRAAVLQAFVRRPAIYPLPWFEQRYGNRARLNLRRTLRRLATGPVP